MSVTAEVPARRRAARSASTEPVVEPYRKPPAAVLGLPRYTRRRLRGIFLHVALISIGSLYLLPMGYMVLRSFTPWELTLGGVRAGDFTLAHFEELNRKLDIQRLILNTSIVTIARVAIQVALSVTAGFAIAQIRFTGNRFVLVTLVSCLMVPFPLMLIPMVVMVRVAGYYNSFAGLIAPTLVSGVGVLLFVQVFRRIPLELIDAARVDGCAPWRILWHVAVPYARSAIGAFALLVSIYSWNEYLWANVATSGPRRQVLTVGVTRLANQYGWSDPGVQMAAATVATLPIIVLAVVLRRLTQVPYHRLPSSNTGRTETGAKPGKADR